MKTILFVCEGNTCRSPMAASIMRSMIKAQNFVGYKITSKGLSAADGGKMAENAKLTLKSLGLKAGGFRSSTLTIGDIKNAYAVITMSRAQKNRLPYENVISAYDLIGEDIPDPYGYDLTVYNGVSKKIIKLCEKIIKEIGAEL